MQALGYLGGKLAVGLVKASGYFLQGVTVAIVDEITPPPLPVPSPPPPPKPVFVQAIRRETEVALVLYWVMWITLPVFIIFFCNVFKRRTRF